MENDKDQVFEVCFELFSIFVMAKSQRDVSSFVSKNFGTCSVECIFPSGEEPSPGQAIYRSVI